MTNENAVTVKDGQPMLMMMRGKTTFIIGMTNMVLLSPSYRYIR